MEKLLSNVQYCFKFVKIVYHTANILFEPVFQYEDNISKIYVMR